MKLSLTLSPSPHVHSRSSTAVLMRDVCIALVPALVWAIVQFGWRCLRTTVFSAAACVVLEWAYRRAMKKDCTIGDWSAVVTGVLLAFVCPADIPYWMLLAGDAFAVVLVKQLFGGIGMNIVNPALAARAFLMFGWPTRMSGAVYGLPDAMSAATPMQALHGSGLPADASLLDAFLGRVGGCIGEISVLMLLLGGAYLVVRRVITLRIPLAYLATVAVLAFVFPRGNDRLVWTAWQLCSGGLLLGAVFMATDYTTSPVTHGGQIAFGIGCGAVTILIRYFGSYVEGVSFAILVMNCCVGFFDKLGLPKRFGLQRVKKGGDAS